MRVFWWGVIHELLPARQIIWRRHIELVAFCKVCGDPEESIRYVLLDCIMAREFWKQTRVTMGMKMPKLN